MKEKYRINYKKTMKTEQLCLYLLQCRNFFCFCIVIFFLTFVSCCQAAEKKRAPKKLDFPDNLKQNIIHKKNETVFLRVIAWIR